MTTTNEHTERAELKACPFCGAGSTEIVENGKMWTGMKYSEPTSVSVRHHCEPIKGQPSRMLERVGKDLSAAIAAWNQRAAMLEAQPAREWDHPTKEMIDAAEALDWSSSDVRGNIVNMWQAMCAKLREKNAGQPAADDKAGGEPVAWVDAENLTIPSGQSCLAYAGPGPRNFNRVALYTHPQPQAEVRVPEGYVLVHKPITEDMHIAAVKVLQRAHGIDGLPQRMLDAMLAAAPKPQDDLPAILKKQAS